MDIEKQVLAVLDEVLSLDGAGTALRTTSPLLGAIPELDSIAIVGVITALEERFGFVAADDELDASVFATVGSLASFVANKTRP